MTNQHTEFLITDEKRRYIQSLKDISRAKSKEYQFTDKQISSILSGIPRIKNICTLLTYYPELTSEPFNLNCKQLTSIVSYRSGSENLKAIYYNYKKLKHKKFATKQIVRMASHEYGVKNIETVLRKYNELKDEKGFTIEQIVRMVSHEYGSKNIETVLHKYNELKDEKEFTIEQIVRMVSHDYGSKNIESVLHNYNELKDEKGFTIEQIVRMVSHDYGSRNIDKVLERFNELKYEKQFTTQQIVQMVSHSGGSKNIETMLEKYNELKNEKQFTTEQIYKLVYYSSGSNKIKIVLEKYNELRDNGFNNEEIIEIVFSRYFIEERIHNAIKLRNTKRAIESELPLSEHTHVDLLEEGLAVFLDCNDNPTSALYDAQACDTMSQQYYTQQQRFQYHQTSSNGTLPYTTPYQYASNEQHRLQTYQNPQTQFFASQNDYNERSAKRPKITTNDSMSFFRNSNDIGTLKQTQSSHTSFRCII